MKWETDLKHCSVVGVLMILMCCLPLNQGLCWRRWRGFQSRTQYCCVDFITSRPRSMVFPKKWTWQDDRVDCLLTSLRASRNYCMEDKICQMGCCANGSQGQTPTSITYLSVVNDHGNMWCICFRKAQKDIWSPCEDEKILKLTDQTRHDTTKKHNMWLYNYIQNAKKTDQKWLRSSKHRQLWLRTKFQRTNST